MAPAVKEVNAYVHSLAGQDVLVLDAYSILVGGDGRTQPRFSRDLLHLTPQGYDALNRELASALTASPGALTVQTKKKERAS